MVNTLLYLVDHSLWHFGTPKNINERDKQVKIISYMYVRIPSALGRQAALTVTPHHPSEFHLSPSVRGLKKQLNFGKCTEHHTLNASF